MRALPLLVALGCFLAFPAVAHAGEVIEGDGYKLRIPSGYTNTFDSCESSGST